MSISVSTHDTRELLMSLLVESLEVTSFLTASLLDKV